MPGIGIGLDNLGIPLNPYAIDFFNRASVTDPNQQANYNILFNDLFQSGVYQYIDYLLINIFISNFC